VAAIIWVHLHVGDWRVTGGCSCKFTFNGNLMMKIMKMLIMVAEKRVMRPGTWTKLQNKSTSTVSFIIDAKVCAEDAVEFHGNPRHIAF